MRRAINRNKQLILRRISCANGSSLSSILLELSRNTGIPLSTLKLNARILRDMGLIAYENGRTEITEAGSLILHLLESESSLISRIAGKMGGNHVKSSISCYGIIKAVLRVKRERDVLILSKGHAAPALYAALFEEGRIGKEELEKAGMPESRLQAHPERGIPEVVVSSGSLGQGLSIANGIALAARIDGIDRKVFVIMGDGELDEGQVWEAAATTSSHRLSNVIAIVDRNGTQLSGNTEVVKQKEPISARWASFGWIPVEGNGSPEVHLRKAVELSEKMDRPVVFIMRS
ncbi:thiamine pyrophosphate-dependent enzyme [Candidatus Methanodesulfokora washburnensis]|nr:thiamine pyrophosphate-dependent enzyme [Candidatus Methanodesulfokores washburnensis]